MSRIQRLAGLFLVGGVVLVGCTEPTPDYCQKSSDCTGGRVCDVARAVCVAADGAVGSVDSPPGADISADRAIDAPGAGEAGVADAPYSSEAVVAVDVPSPIDVAEADVPMDTATVDVARPDINVPDGAGTCGANGDCPDPTKAFCVGGMCVGCQPGVDGGLSMCGAQVCEVVSGRCVECTVDGQCTKDAAKGFCVANACTGCATSGATGCAARTDGKIVCAVSSSAAGQCVECVGDTDCKDPAKSFCVANVCGGCQVAVATACSVRSASKPVCATSGTSSGTCVECSADTDCKDPTKSFCVANACGGCQTASATACSVRSAGKPVCATSGTPSGTCVECSADTDCKDPTKSFCVANACGGCQTAAANACSVRSASKPVCATSGNASGTCVECAASSDCKVATLPICATTNTCVACKADAECIAKLGATGNPGVCLANIDGHCATDAETVYVQSVVGCSTTTSGGSSAVPFCAARVGVNVAGTTNGKTLVVLTGALADFGVAVSTKPLTVVGKGAVITPALATTDGIDITSGEIYLRGITVKDATSPGIGIKAAPDTGSTVTLHLDTCAVTNNAGGGILLNGAAFDIKNTTVTGNGPGLTAGYTWGGILVQNPPPVGSTTSLNLVTIKTNGALGLDCAGTIQIEGSGVLATGNVTADISGCGFTSCVPDGGATCGAQAVP